MRLNYLSIHKLQRRNRWSLVMNKSFHPTFHNGCDYISMLGLKLTHLSKRAPGSSYSLSWYSECLHYLYWSNAHEDENWTQFNILIFAYKNERSLMHTVLFSIQWRRNITIPKCNICVTCGRAFMRGGRETLAYYQYTSCKSIIQID